MEDIRNIKPDLVVAMGDFGENACLGSPDAIQTAGSFLKKTGVPVRPLLGNHDLQQEIGRGLLPRGTMESKARQCFHVEDTYFVAEYESFRLFGISLDSWDMEPPYSKNECHVGTERFAWIKEKLSERPGVPVVMLTHAPPMGSGLLTIPDMHVRATNAYMDQNTDPMRWIGLTEHPEIILWLSAHYHIGHDHQGSMVTRNGVTYALTGVHGNVSRDGTRQSRILDVCDGRAALFTLDHEARHLRGAPDWQEDLAAAVARRKALPSRVAPPRTKGWLESLSPLGAGGIQALPNGHLLVSTADHYLWEADPAWEVLLGTLHYQEGPLADYCLSGWTVWRAFGKTLAAVDGSDPWRFSRETRGDHRREYRIALPAAIDRLQPLANGVRVFMGKEVADIYPADCPPGV